MKVRFRLLQRDDRPLMPARRASLELEKRSEQHQDCETLRALTVTAHRQLGARRSAKMPLCLGEHVEDLPGHRLDRDGVSVVHRQDLLNFAQARSSVPETGMR